MNDLSWAIAWGIVAGAAILLLIVILLAIVGAAISWAVERNNTKTFMQRHIVDDDPYEREGGD